MNKHEIFDEIVKIMREDSSSLKDESGADPEAFAALIQEEMSKEAFLFLMKEYLATFHLTGHLNLSLKDFGRPRVFVRRYEDRLYVYEAADGADLKMGDIITRLDGVSIEEYANAHKDLLQHETIERQTPHWNTILPFVSQVTILEDGVEKEVELHRTTEKWDYIPYFGKKLNEETMYLYFSDFLDEESIQKIYQEYAETMDSCKYLVVDVRGNSGGMDTAFMPLLKYALPNGLKYTDIDTEGDPSLAEGQEIIFSERNCDLREQAFAEYLAADLPKESRAILNQMLEELHKNRGKGFVKSFEEEPDLPFVGDSKVEKFFIITDECCASSGDSFVAEFARFDKVIVVGRPTMGILDYSNVTFVDLGPYKMVYPTSRSIAVDSGKGMMRRGVSVDHYIPWTPEHLKKDVDLEYVLSQLK